MDSANPAEGVVYTETTVYSPPQQYVAEAPYQIAIVDLGSSPPNGPGRITVRILADSPAERVRIGDRVSFVENRDGVSYFRKAPGLTPA
ncbi:MAG TPA: OB-fold domain-containing protein [Bryobacteraceae bacterium]|nr:OB-fold domain-containing protein [Bryobacteraceae bacterium]